MFHSKILSFSHLAVIAVAALVIPNNGFCQERSATIINLSDQFEDLFEWEGIGIKSDGSLLLAGNSNGWTRQNAILGDGGPPFRTVNNIPRIVSVSADRSSVTSSRLAGLESAETVVTGISSDGHRLSGTSLESTRLRALTWLGSSPNSPTSLAGDLLGATSASGAFRDGVVGVFGVGVPEIGIGSPSRWTNGVFEELPNATLSFAFSASNDGAIVGGFEAIDFGVGRAIYWDDTGKHVLNDPMGIQSAAETISSSRNHIGGYFFFFEPDTFRTGPQPALWSGDNYELNQLEFLDPATNQLSRAIGSVAGITDSGWAVGFQTDGVTQTGFIWHESFNGIDSEYNGVQIFDDWLLNETGLLLPTPSHSVVGIVEDPSNGELSFAVNGSACVVSVQAPLSLLGDANRDGVVNFLDISAFIALLSTSDFLAEADVNDDGMVNFLDISPFIAILSGS